MKMKLDPWQEEVMRTKGNICLRSGRQVGKSTVIGLKAAKYAMDNKNKLIMVISKTERQAGLLFAKILYNLDRKEIAKRKGIGQNPTKHKIILNNGSVIHSLPCGDTGFGIMGFTIDLLIADEAAFIPEEVWNSIIPALAITRGEIWLLSTPFVKDGYYYNCFQDPAFTAFHTSSEDCPRKDVAFLERQKATLTKAQYAQMYLGQFVDELRQFFPDNLIRNCCIGKRRERIIEGSYYYGADVARMDRDEFSHEIIDFKENNLLIHVESIITKDVTIPNSCRTIIELNKQYEFIKEYIDSGGMGITVCDILREDEDNKNLVVEINNASRVVGEKMVKGKIKKQKKTMAKEDLYNNLKRLMEQGKIKILDDDEIKASLKSIQAEHDPNTGKLKIWGSYSHITEGLIRAAWCAKDKSLNIWVDFQ